MKAEYTEKEENRADRDRFEWKRQEETVRLKAAV